MLSSELCLLSLLHIKLCSFDFCLVLLVLILLLVDWFISGLISTAPIVATDISALSTGQIDVIKLLRGIYTVMYCYTLFITLV